MAGVGLSAVSVAMRGDIKDLFSATVPFPVAYFCF